jgi:tetratricopeptide (TPR) repeat protein
LIDNMRFLKLFPEAIRKYHLGSIGIFTLLTYYIYPPGFIGLLNNTPGGYAFLYDDINLIILNPLIKDWSNFFELFTIGRPIRAITFMIDWQIWGQNPFGFHLTNILLHLLATILLYFFINILSRNRRLAFMAGLLFITHPIQTEAVVGISHRKEMLAMIFFVLSFILYLKKDRSFLFYLASIFAYILGLLSKQVVVILPLLLAFYDYYFPSEESIKKLKRNIRYYIPYLIVPLLGMFLRYGDFRPFTYFGLKDFMGKSYILLLGTMSRAVIKYIQLLLFPFNLSIDYYFPLSTSILEGRIFFSLLAIAFLLLLTLKTYRNYRILSFGLAWFLVNLIPILNIIPANYILADRYLYIPSVGFCLIIASLFDCFYTNKAKLFSGKFKLYIPWLISIAILVYNFGLLEIYESKGISILDDLSISLPAKKVFSLVLIFTIIKLLLLIAPFFWFIFRKIAGESVQQVTVFLLIMLVSSYSFLTIDRKKDWRNGYVLWTKTIVQNPRSITAHHNLGFYHYRNEQYDQAIFEFRKAIELDPDYSSEVYFNLGNIYVRKAQYDEAAKEYQKALEINPQFEQCYINMGNIYTLKGMVEDAIDNYEKAIEISPGYARAHYNLVGLYEKKGLLDEAVRECQKAVELAPWWDKAYFQLGNLYYKKGAYPEALEAYRRAAEMNPHYWPFYQNFMKDYQDWLNR